MMVIFHSGLQLEDISAPVLCCADPAHPRAETRSDISGGKIIGSKLKIAGLRGKITGLRGKISGLRGLSGKITGLSGKSLV
jgi:hypothetical protein